MRAFAEETYGIPPERVIGSAGKQSFELRDGRPVLVKLPALDFMDDKEGKPIAIPKNRWAQAHCCVREFLATCRCCNGRASPMPRAFAYTSTIPTGNVNGRLYRTGQIGEIYNRWFGKGGGKPSALL